MLVKAIVKNENTIKSVVTKTHVTFHHFDREEILNYIQSISVLDKSGRWHMGARIERTRAEWLKKIATNTAKSYGLNEEGQRRVVIGALLDYSHGKSAAMALMEADVNARILANSRTMGGIS